MISKRKLMKYRKEALQFKDNTKDILKEASTFEYDINLQLDRLLELTQELIDQHLLEEK